MIEAHFPDGLVALNDDENLLVRIVERAGVPRLVLLPGHGSLGRAPLDKEGIVSPLESSFDVVGTGESEVDLFYGVCHESAIKSVKIAVLPVHRA